MRLILEKGVPNGDLVSHEPIIRPLRVPVNCRWPVAGLAHPLRVTTILVLGVAAPGGPDLSQPAHQWSGGCRYWYLSTKRLQWWGLQLRVLPKKGWGSAVFLNLGVYNFNGNRPIPVDLLEATGCSFTPKRLRRKAKRFSSTKITEQNPGNPTSHVVVSIHNWSTLKNNRTGLQG